MFKATAKRRSMARHEKLQRLREAEKARRPHTHARMHARTRVRVHAHTYVQEERPTVEVVDGKVVPFFEANRYHKHTHHKHTHHKHTHHKHHMQRHKVTSHDGESHRLQSPKSLHTSTPPPQKHYPKRSVVGPQKKRGCARHSDAAAITI